MRAVNRLAERSINARSEVRDGLFGLSHDLRPRPALPRRSLPLRKRISDENLLRYNGMLISVFELLADAREQIASVTPTIEALRDFWLADADLQTALITADRAGAMRVIERRTPRSAQPIRARPIDHEEST